MYLHLKKKKKNSCFPVSEHGKTQSEDEESKFETGYQFGIVLLNLN